MKTLWLLGLSLGVLMTSAYGQLVVKNNSVELMTVNNTGDVVIGTAQQDGTLTVLGSTTTATLKVSDGAASGRVLKSDAEGNASWGTDLVDDDDADPDNEIQTLALAGNTLQISDGNSVNLPSGTDNQTLNFNSTTRQLSIDRGNTVTIADNTGLTSVNSDNTLKGNGTSGSPLGVNYRDFNLNNGSVLVTPYGGSDDDIYYTDDMYFSYDIAGESVLTLSSLTESRLRLMGSGGSKILLSPNGQPASNVALTATPSYPDGYASTDSRLYTNAGIVAEGSASRFVNSVVVGVGTSGVTDGYLGVRGGATGSEAFHVHGDAIVSGSFTATSKSFVQAIPEDPSKKVVYYSIESGENITVFRTRGQLQNGRAVVNLPEHYSLVTSGDIDVHVTDVDDDGHFTVFEIINATPQQIEIAAANLDGSTAHSEFALLVMGERRGFEDSIPLRDKDDESMLGNGREPEAKYIFE